MPGRLGNAHPKIVPCGPINSIDYAVPPPELGSSTASILGQYLEYSALEITALRKKAMI